jgi:NAD(P)H-dependent FMN reductase
MAEQQFRVLGVVGSLREQSRCALALGLFLDAAQQRGAETRLLDLRGVELPLYRPDRSSDSVAAQRMEADMDWADGVVLASPDYHGSMSGAMKNFLDHNFEVCAGKLFAYICSSHEKGLTAMDQMRTAVRQCYGWSLPYGLSFDARSDFDAQGSLRNSTVEQRLKMMARDVVTYGTLLRRQFLADLASAEASTFAAKYRE